jgi:hypothetical protein
MTLDFIDPSVFSWDQLVPEKLKGESGVTDVWIKNFGGLRIRQVVYSTNYVSDHWCDKGHVVYVVSGELIIKHKDNSELTIQSGATYVVGDNSMAHKAISKIGATVFIVD